MSRLAPTRSLTAVRARRDDSALLSAYAKTRDPRVREELVLRHLPLAREVARRHASSHVPSDDLIQLATLGLIHAIDRFDPSRGFAFSSFAVPTIAGQIRRHLRDQTWTVRPPRELQELTLRVERARDDLSRERGRPPTAGDIAEHLGVPCEDVLEAIQAGQGRGRVSLEQPQGEEDDDSTFGATLGGLDREFDRVDAAITAELALAELSERVVLHLRFHDDLTQREIGERVGLSQMQVSRILHAALVSLQQTVGATAEAA